MPTRIEALLAYFITIVAVYFFIIDDDEDPFALDPPPYQPIGFLPAVDVVGQLYGTPFFGHHLNVNERLFQRILLDIGDAVGAPRNNQFIFSEQQNQQRRRRRCKLSIPNRIAMFLRFLGEDIKIWSQSQEFQTSISSVHRDMVHIGIIFLKKYQGLIRPLSPHEKVLNRLFEGYPTAEGILDGSMFRRTVPSPSDPTMYDYKRKHGSSQNVQAICTKTKVITHLLTGVPGRMCDTNASKFIGNDMGSASIMVDGGYHNDTRFIGPDGTHLHKRQRSGIERVFGRVKMDSAAVGGYYRRGKRWQSLFIWDSFLLYQLKLVYGGNRR